MLALLAWGCSFPPFNEDLSLAMITASKMGEPVAEIGPLSAGYGEYEGTEHYYIPQREDPLRGFLVASNDYSISFRFVDPGQTALKGWWSVELSNSDPNTLNFKAETIESGAGSYLSFLRFDPLNDYKDNTLVLLQFNPPDQILAAPLHLRNYLTPFLTNAPTIIGTNIFPDTTVGADPQYFLCQLDSTGLFTEVKANTDTILGVTYSGVVRGDMDLALPAEMNNAFYFYNPVNNTSYLSYYSRADKKYKNYSWQSSATLTELAGIKWRIDAVLSSQELLSFDSSACYVYDQAGNRQYSFPLGGLRFVYEKWDSAAGANKLYFTLPVWAWGEAGDQLYLNVYSILTTELAALD